MMSTASSKPQPEQMVAKADFDRRRWHVVRFYGRSSYIAKEIASNGIIAYMPVRRTRITVRLTTGRRAREEMRPLFPGYMFARFDPDDDRLWSPILSVDGVLGLLCHESRPVPVPDSTMLEIRQVEAELEAEGRLRPRTRGLKIGGLVRVIEGPFASFFGHVTEMHPHERNIVVEVDIFGRATPVRLEPECVEIVT